MSGVRPFRQEDLKQVAELFVHRFRPGGRADVQVVQSHFELVYFNSPWSDPEVSSLVLEMQGGRIAGFLGVVPRPMQALDRPITMAVIGNLMVDPEVAGAFASAQLLRICMRGPQDLTVTDSAGDPARRVWTSCGGSTALASSLQWVRPLRPVSFYVGSRLGRHSLLRALALPPCRFLDLAVRPLVSRQAQDSPDSLREELTTDKLVELIPRLPVHEIYPRYDTADLAWLLRAAAMKRNHGSLRSALVRDKNSGNAIGWYVYYLNRRGCSRVLQLVAVDGSAYRVFGSLMSEAMRGGSHAVSGRLDPRLMRDAAEQDCFFTTQSWVLAHGHNHRIVEAFLQGRVFFSGLEGEEWMRFMGDPLEEE